MGSVAGITQFCKMHLKSVLSSFSRASFSTLCLSLCSLSAREGKDRCGGFHSCAASSGCGNFSEIW